MNTKCAVIIPVFKEKLSIEEKISLQRIDEIVKYPIYFVAPEGLVCSVYKEMIPHAKFIFFMKEFFEGFQGYNRLMTSVEFYREFIAFEKIVICQTDVFVIDADWDEFIDMSYDYIGAPIAKHKPWSCELRVGNGGFSMRNVEKVIYAIEMELQGKCTDKINEDTFFSSVGEKRPDIFSVAPVDVALKFAFDQPLADLSYKLARGNTPKAIHGWYNYDVSVSSQLLKQYLPNEFAFKVKDTYEKELEKLKKIVMLNKRTFIYGAGDIGKVLAQYMLEKEICFEGFIVSDNQTIAVESVFGKNIKHLKDIEGLDDATVVIAILQRYRSKSDYVEQLKEHNTKNILEMNTTMIFALEALMLESKMLSV